MWIGIICFWFMKTTDPNSSHLPIVHCKNTKKTSPIGPTVDGSELLHHKSQVVSRISEPSTVVLERLCPMFLPKNNFSTGAHCLCLWLFCLSPEWSATYPRCVEGRKPMWSFRWFRFTRATKKKTPASLSMKYRKGEKGSLPHGLS